MLLMHCSWAQRNFFFVKWLTPLLHLRVLCANLVVLYHSWSGICTSPPINCSPRAEPWRRLRLSPSTSEKPNMLQRNSCLDECFSTTTSHCTLGTHACNSPCTRFFSSAKRNNKRKKRNQSLRDYHHQDYLQFSPPLQPRIIHCRKKMYAIWPEYAIFPPSERAVEGEIQGMVNKWESATGCDWNVDSRRTAWKSGTERRTGRDEGYEEKRRVSLRNSCITVEVHDSRGDEAFSLFLFFSMFLYFFLAKNRRRCTGDKR